MAGAQVIAAIDMWHLARDTYLDNFDGALFFCQKVETLDPRKVAEEIGPVNLMLASPECTSHTCARGNGERSETSSMTAFQVNRFAQVMKPRWIVIENVIHMRAWHRYTEWLTELRGLGYKLREQVLNAADFGVPQSRKRLFIVCDSEKEPPEVRPPSGLRVRTVRDILRHNGNFRYSKLKSNERAKATLERAERAMAEIGDHAPFLIVYYGSDGAGGWQGLQVPLRTVTTLDRFAYVRPARDGHQMRMLQVPELKKAMGFPARYRLNHGVRRDQIRLLGNAVCPHVMKAIIKAVTQGAGCSG